ncbi:MAG: MATE family efflux transporter [Clostridiaceae bacterium]
MKIRNLVGDRSFYRMVSKLATPILIQTGIVNLVSLLNTVMVGQLGTEKMSGVAIANQLLNVSNVCVAGAISGIGIFTAQYYGKRDDEGLRQTFRFKLASSLLLTVLSVAVFLLFGPSLIGTFVHSGDAAQTLASAWDYLKVMMIGLIPYALSLSYSTTLRETHSTVLPMIGSSVAIVTNLVLNYALIFGRLGCPALGASGAAVATVASRFAELLILIIGAHAKSARNTFLRGAYRADPIPILLLKEMTVRSAPLLLNETIYSASYAVVVQSLSLRGIAAVAAYSIAANVTQLFFIVLMSVGVSLGILVGNQLGAGCFDEARVTNARLTALAIAVCVATGLVLLPVSVWFPRLFNTTEEVRQITGSLIRVVAYMLPIRGFTHAAYYTLRAGGKTIHTLFYDGGYVTLICLPITFILAHYTNLPIVPLYAVCLALELSKSIIGFYWVKKGIWVRCVVPQSPASTENPC